MKGYRFITDDDTSKFVIVWRKPYQMDGNCTENPRWLSIKKEVWCAVVKLLSKTR